MHHTTITKKPQLTKTRAETRTDNKYIQRQNSTIESKT